LEISCQFGLLLHGHHPRLEDVWSILVSVPGIGMTHSSFFFRLRVETSSFETVSGFNKADSCQRVSLPGAAPVSA
jgi:hypothetical protein